MRIFKRICDVRYRRRIKRCLGQFKHWSDVGANRFNRRSHNKSRCLAVMFIQRKRCSPTNTVCKHSGQLELRSNMDNDGPWRYKLLKHYSFAGWSDHLLVCRFFPFRQFKQRGHLQQFIECGFACMEWSTHGQLKRIRCYRSSGFKSLDCNWVTCQHKFNVDERNNTRNIFRVLLLFV